jgi:two-component system response regulator RegX3
VNADSVLTRVEIWGTVWNDRHVPIRLVDWYICRLRDKLEPDPSNPRHILALGGGNYKFVLNPRPTLRDR